MGRPEMTEAAKAEAAAAREAGMAQRRDILSAVGLGLHGAKWITPLAEDIARVAERQVLRGTVSQWDSLHRPIPAWAWDALGQLARDGSAKLRKRADALDSAFQDSAPPGPEEPPVEEDPGRIEAAIAACVSSAAEASEDDDAEVDAIHEWMGSLPPPPSRCRLPNRLAP